MTYNYRAFVAAAVWAASVRHLSSGVPTLPSNPTVRQQISYAVWTHAGRWINRIADLASAASGADRVWTWTAFAGADHYVVSVNGVSEGTQASPYTVTGGANTSQAIVVQALDSGGNVIAQSVGGFNPGLARLPAGNYLPWLNL